MTDSPSTSTASSPHAGRLAALAVIVIALVARALYVGQAVETVHFGTPILDARTNWEAAQLWERGGGPPRPFFKAPLYPWMIGMALRPLAALMPREGDQIASILMMQLALGILAAWLAWRVGRSAGGIPAGVVAGLTCGLAGAMIFFESELLDTSLSALLLIAAVAALASEARPTSLLSFGLAGVLIGLAIIDRPTCGLVWLGLLFWTLLSQRVGERPWAAAFARMGLLAAPVLVLVGLVAFANSWQTPIATYGGPNFWLANHAGADGYTTAVPQTYGSPRPGEDYIERFALQEASARLGHEVSGVEADHYWRARGVDFWIGSPQEATLGTLRRSLFFWQGPEIKNIKNVSFVAEQIPVLRALLFVNWFWLAPLGIVGLWIGSRRGNAAARLCAIALIATFVASIPFPVNTRYRLPALPFLCVGSGIAIAGLLHALRSRRLHTPLVMAGWIAGLAFVLHFDWANQPDERYRDWWQFGNLAVERGNERAGDLQLAEEAFNHALAINPQHLESQVNLARLWMMEGRVPEAMARLERTIRDTPDYPVAHALHGQALMLAGQTASAEQSLARALELDPTNAGAGVGLTLVLFESGRHREAEALANRLTSIGVDAWEIWRVLAWTRSEVGDLAGARVAVARARAINPSLDFAQFPTGLQ